MKSTSMSAARNIIANYEGGPEIYTLPNFVHLAKDLSNFDQDENPTRLELLASLTLDLLRKSLKKIIA